MTPLGEQIRISKPQEVNTSYFIKEKEAVHKATVEGISPDIQVPFKVSDTVYFFTNSEVLLKGEYFINVETVVGYDSQKRLLTEIMSEDQKDGLYE